MAIPSCWVAGGNRNNSSPHNWYGIWNTISDPCEGELEYRHRSLRVVRADEKGTRCLGGITGPPCSWGI
jgi:hypothetical protein